MKKKILAIVLLMAMAVSAFGCGKVNVKLGDYKSMVLTKVTDKEVEETIADLLEENAGCIEVDREAAKDDTVNIDYKGVYYGTVSVTYKFELEAGRDSYSFTPGTLNGTEFTALYTEGANNYDKLEPAAAVASGSNHYLNNEGAIVIANKEATSLTIVIKADYAKEIIEKKLLLTAKTNGVKVTSVRVLGVSSSDDKDYTADSSYVGDGNLISTVSYEAFSNVYGVAFSGGTAEGYDLKLGSGNFIPGFEDQLIGHKAGEEVAVALSFPDSYTQNTRLSAQPVIFTVKLNKVKEDPKFDDTFAKYMEYDSAEAYRTYIVDTMNNNSFESQITENLLKICTVKNLPKKDVEEYTNNVVDYYTNMANYYVQLYAAYGYSSITADYIIKNMFGFSGGTEELKEFAEQYANDYLSTKYIVQKIISAEKLTVTDEDFAAAEKEYITQAGYETAEKFYSENATTDALKKEIKEEIQYAADLKKVLDYIKGVSVIKEADNSTTDTKEN